MGTRGGEFRGGLGSVLALAPFHFWPVLFVTLPMLVWTARRRRDAPTLRERLRRAAGLGWFAGFGYFLGGLYWMGGGLPCRAREIRHPVALRDHGHARSPCVCFGPSAPCCRHGLLASGRRARRRIRPGVVRGRMASRPLVHRLSLEPVRLRPDRRRRLAAGRFRGWRLWLDAVGADRFHQSGSRLRSGRQS